MGDSLPSAIQGYRKLTYLLLHFPGLCSSLACSGVISVMPGYGVSFLVRYSGPSSFLHRPLIPSSAPNLGRCSRNYLLFYFSNLRMYNLGGLLRTPCKENKEKYFNLGRIFYSQGLQWAKKQKNIRRGRGNSQRTHNTHHRGFRGGESFQPHPCLCKKSAFDPPRAMATLFRSHHVAALWPPIQRVSADPPVFRPRVYSGEPQTKQQSD